ncbi:MAG: DUF4332 domain-containing protein [Gammaproteobacteria bacterium]|jgi:predicted flap endonuclease-1-like 5' DNA nuclease|nr:DUF4332 domain-containing protein [Gammaproteobacteria bacterium]NNK34012.1 DUF4332 domain-containing protein [Xanthomonadales bacterium]
MSKSIETIEGIGPKTGASLRKAGIRTVEKLLETACAKRGRKALAAETGINEKTLLRCVNMADLFRINGVASQYAELLEAAGVDTVKELRNRNSDNLAAKMADVNAAKRLVRVTPSANVVAKWVAQAKVLPPKVTY